MDIQKEYNKYRFLADWTASKVFNASTLPIYIKEEFVYEARQALIITLNKCSKMFKNNNLTKKQAQFLKNRIGWDALNAINKYHCSYVGCKTLITQKKHNLYPSNMDDQSYSSNTKHSPYSPYIFVDQHLTNTNCPIEPIMDKETSQNAIKITQRLFKLLNIKKHEQDILLLNFDNYILKYGNKITYKQYDNTKSKLKALMKARISQDEQYYKSKLDIY